MAVMSERVILATHENFDEVDYLAANPDVAASVARGENPSGYEHFRRMGHRESRRLRVERVAYESQSGLTTPLPDAELVFLVQGNRDVAAFDETRRGSVEALIAYLVEVGIGYGDFGTILDFGCGCGRVLAGWEGRLAAATRLLGCDVNEVLVEFCRGHIGHAEVVRCGYYPPLPYADGSVDFVYAASVYTHLSVAAMLQWTGELARILRPGGITMVTTMGSYFAPQLAGISERGAIQLAERGYAVELYGSAEETWKGSNRYGAFVSADFVRRLFIGFEVVRVFPGVLRGYNNFSGYQDVAIFRRSD
jgi:SAM-dependent methyltransferase